MNIIEVLRCPIGTKIKTDINDKVVLEVIEENNAKFLILEGDFRKVFIDSVLSEAKFWIQKDLKI